MKRKLEKTIYPIILMIIILISGCHSVDEPYGANITICNDDSYEYTVILYNYPDENVARTTYLTNYYDEFGQCDDFSDLNEGRYYMTIIDEDSMCEFDRTDVFYATDYDSFYFYIDQDGGIVRDGH